MRTSEKQMPKALEPTFWQLVKSKSRRLSNLGSVRYAHDSGCRLVVPAPIETPLHCFKLHERTRILAAAGLIVLNDRQPTAKSDQHSQNAYMGETTWLLTARASAVTQKWPIVVTSKPANEVTTDPPGEHIGQLCKLMHAQQGEPAVRRIQGILSFTKKYGIARVEDACAAALEPRSHRLPLRAQLSETQQPTSHQSPASRSTHPSTQSLSRPHLQKKQRKKNHNHE